jgi:hypothetical protein
MTDIPPNRTTFAVRKVDRAESDKMRTDIVRLILQRMVSGLRAQLDASTWISAGYVELEAFVHALCNGGRHPVLSAWEADMAAPGRPVPSTRESLARRITVLLCAALERAGYSRAVARKYAVKEFAAAGLFNGALSPRVIERWQAQERPLMPGDELLVATGFAAAGGQPARLAVYFVGLCHLALNPTAMVIREGSAEKGEFIGD